EGHTSYAPESDTIMCGCFTGTLDEFAQRVDEEHGDNIHGKRYRALIEMFRSYREAFTEQVTSPNTNPTTQAKIMSKGFYAIGVYRPKTEVDIGTLWRTANILGASLIFTVGVRYKRQSSDVLNTPKHIPLIHFEDVEDLV